MYLMINKGTLARQKTLKESAGSSRLPRRKTFLTQATYPAVFQLNVTCYPDFPSVGAGFLAREK